MLFLALTIVIMVTAVLRLLPGLLWRAANSDAGYHLLLRREIRRNRMRMPRRIAALALDERQTYPWLYHWLLALVPGKWLERAPALPSALIDALHAALTFGLAAWLAPLAQPGLDPAVAGLAAGLLFATSPALLAIGIGPRAYEITPRPFGELLFSASLIAAGAALSDGSVWAALAAVLTAALILLSSKFAAQVLVFCVPIVALASGQWLLLLLPLAALGAALLLSGGRYWGVLAAQVIHLRLYRARLQYDHPALVLLNQWRQLWETLLGAVRSGFRDRTQLQKLVRTVEFNTYVQFVIRNVLWWGTLLLVLAGALPTWSESAGLWERWLWAWTLAPIVPFLVSSLPRWRFLGEAERYLEYALLPMCVLAAVGVLRLPSAVGRALLTAYIGLTALTLAYTFWRRRWNSRSQRGEAIEELVSYLETLPARSIVLAIPSILAFAIAYRLEHRFLTAIDTFVWARDYDRLFHQYPWPSTDLEWWRRAHGVQYIVFMTAGSTRGYDFTDCLRVFASREYHVYRAGTPPPREGLMFVAGEALAERRSTEIV